MTRDPALQADMTTAWGHLGCFLLGVTMTMAFVVPDSRTEGYATLALCATTLLVLGRARSESWRRSLRDIAELVAVTAVAIGAVKGAVALGGLLLVLT